MSKASIYCTLYEVKEEKEVGSALMRRRRLERFLLVHITSETTDNYPAATVHMRQIAKSTHCMHGNHPVHYVITWLPRPADPFLYESHCSACSEHCCTIRTSFMNVDSLPCCHYYLIIDISRCMSYYLLYHCTEKITFKLYTIFVKTYVGWVLYACYREYMPCVNYIVHSYTIQSRAAQPVAGLMYNFTGRRRCEFYLIRRFNTFFVTFTRLTND